MRKLITLVVALTVMAVPSAALAAAPEVVFDGTDGFQGTLPPGAICEFAVDIDESVEVRVTLFKDNDGNITKERVHVVGRTTWSTDYGTVVEHWAVSDTYYPATDTVVVTGNRWNGHSPGGGVVINGSGRLEFNFATGELMTNGPAEDTTEEGYEAFCGVLAP